VRRRGAALALEIFRPNGIADHAGVRRAGRSPQPLAGSGASQERTMPSLNLYLTDGFDNDQVVVHVDGRKVFEADGVTTRKLLGLARQLDPVSVAGNTARLDIELPKKGLSVTISADLTRGSHVPVAVENGRLTHSVHKQIGFA
jgi:hypothetical protein